MNVILNTRTYKKQALNLIDCLLKNSTDNQRGQAMVELALLMTFLAMILGTLIVFFELGATNISTIEHLRYGMRTSMYDHADGNFTKKPLQKTATVVIPGKMKQVFGKPFFSTDHQIEFFEGSYHGPGKNKYRKRKSLRIIDLQN